MSRSYSPSHLPLGVAIIAVLMGLFGVFLLLVWIVVLLFSSAGVGGLAYFGASTIGALLLILFAILILVVARGLWDQELWALALSIVVVGLLWASDILAGRILTLGSLILLFLLVYLIAVHRQFT